jgi:hypothetical protein
MKNTNPNSSTMKTTLYIITALLTFSFNTLPDRSNAAPVRNITGTELNPVIPAIATFEESVPDQDNHFALALRTLAPVTPEEADFNESTPEAGVQTLDLAPETPDTAEFEDSI